jgi:hypothetical protein
LRHAGFPTFKPSTLRLIETLRPTPESLAAAEAALADETARRSGHDALLQAR